MLSFKRFVKGTNDNPSKEDIVRATRDTMKRRAHAKTSDEEDFYKRKAEALKKT